MRFVSDHCWYEFRAPYITRSTRDRELVRKAAGHVHDVGHKCQGSELVRELAAEEEEVRIRGIGCLEVVECDFVRNPFALDSREDLCAKRVILGLIYLVWRRRPKPFHSEEDRFVFVLIIAPAMVFIYPLK